MKIHIVQRSDTFESIAKRYGISVQDLIGTNTHINYASGLVPGLKVKIPIPPRQEEPMVDQHIQKYYPSIDMQTNYVQAATLEQPKPVTVQPVQEVTTIKEEVMTVPLKPISEVMPTKPNDGVIKQTVTITPSVKTQLSSEMEHYLFHINCQYYKKDCQTPVMPCGGYYPEDSRLLFGPFGGFGGYGGFGYPGYGYGYGYNPWRPYGYGYGYGRWY